MFFLIPTVKEKWSGGPFYLYAFVLLDLTTYCMLSFRPLNAIKNKDITNKDDNEQVQLMFEHSVYQTIKATRTLVSPNYIIKKSL